MTVERNIVEHYRHGALEEALLASLAAAGKDIERLTPEDLAPADEFHIGGRQATVEFAAEFSPEAGTHFLDIGSGLGGPSRYIAQQYRCRVTGIDLSEEFVTVAASLSQRVGLAEQVDYRQGSATELPFDRGTFDGAYMQHVGMNIADKAKLFSEVHRVLKPGGMFALYDVMRIAEGPFSYPVPWASDEETNFIETPATYRALLTAEGFELVKERSRQRFALDFFRDLQAKIARAGGPAKFGMQVVLGPTSPQKIGNMIAMIERGIVAPIEMICRRVEPTRFVGSV